VEGRLKRSDLFRKGFDKGFEGFNKFMDQARTLDPLKDLGRDRKTRLVKKKEVVFHEGDELRQVPYVVKGKLRTFKINNDGKEFVTGLHGEGDLVGYMGLLESGRALETAEALEDVEIALVPREDLLALLYKDRDVSIRFIKMLAGDVREKEEHLLQLAYSSVRQRVAQALLRVHARYGVEDGSDLGLHMSREDLATIVGTATESLIRCLTDLKEEKLIDTQGRSIRIANKSGLEKLARG